jgi:hypothetical protein
MRGTRARLDRRVHRTTEIRTLRRRRTKDTALRREDTRPAQRARSRRPRTTSLSALAAATPLRLKLRSRRSSTPNAALSVMPKRCATDRRASSPSRASRRLPPSLPRDARQRGGRRPERLGVASPAALRSAADPRARRGAYCSGGHSGTLAQAEDGRTGWSVAAPGREKGRGILEAGPFGAYSR